MGHARRKGASHPPKPILADEGTDSASLLPPGAAWVEGSEWTVERRRYAAGFHAVAASEAAAAKLQAAKDKVGASVAGAGRRLAKARTMERTLGKRLGSRIGWDDDCRPLHHVRRTKLTRPYMSAAMRATPSTPGATASPPGAGVPPGTDPAPPPPEVVYHHSSKKPKTKLDSGPRPMPSPPAALGADIDARIEDDDAAKSPTDTGTLRAVASADPQRPKRNKPKGGGCCGGRPK